ncbi:MAG: hypothetical protein ACLU99_15055 [Alphaproteobacteria bacterium]
MPPQTRMFFLALALVTVVGALVLFASNTDKSAKNQQKLNEAQKAWLDYLETEATRNEPG